MIISWPFRTTRRALVVVAVACMTVLGGTAGAQAAPGHATASTELQQALQTLVTDGVPGAIALERQGGSTWHAAAGFANLATGEPASPYDRYRIGSITKSFTSTVVLQLEAEGRLSLNDSVEKWLPGLVPNGSAITIHELMNHTSGIPNYTDLPLFLQILHDPLKSYTPRELVERAVANPPLFPPGTSWEYSNTNYILLGMIIAVVDYVPAALQSYAPVLEADARIIARLGLRHTSWPVTDPQIRGLHTHGYEINPPPELDLPPVYDTTVESPTWAWSAGAIISTLDDVAAFHRALFTGKLLPPAQQQELLDMVSASPGLDYGLGVFELQTPCGPAYGHDGGTPASYTFSLISPDGSRQLELLSNQDANSFTDQEFADYNAALITGYCGQTPTGTAVRSAATTMRQARAALRAMG
jgi:D-alanyl-D-alanine carboxypeptidase